MIYTFHLQSSLSFIPPIEPLELEKSELYSIVSSLLDGLTDGQRSFFLQNLMDPYFIRRRSFAINQESQYDNERVSKLLHILDDLPEERITSAITAISIITGTPPKPLLEQLFLDVPQGQLSIMNVLFESAQQVTSGPIFTFDERTTVLPTVPQLPCTTLWIIPGNPYLDIPTEVPSFPSNVIAEEFLTQKNWKYDPRTPPPHFYTEDLSKGSNPAHFLPPVPCYNWYDNKEPEIISWMSHLALPDSISNKALGCACHHDCDCLTCHRTIFQPGTSLSKPTMCYREDGTINIDDLYDCQPLVVECNDECECNPLTCKNRIVQNGPKLKLIIKRMPTKGGWGVFAGEFIPKGRFVCEYIGEVLVDPEAAEDIGFEYDQKLESYLFDLDGWGVDESEMLTVDPSKAGNVSKFINHSCEPNLITISIGIYKSERFQRIGFFAMRDIFPNEELGFNYAYKLTDMPENAIPCSCGSIVCRGRLR